MNANKKKSDHHLKKKKNWELQVVPGVHALSQDMCVETLPMPIIAPIAVHRQFAWLSSLMPYSGVYIAYLVLHYPNYNSFCY